MVTVVTLGSRFLFVTGYKWYSRLILATACLRVFGVNLWNDLKVLQDDNPEAWVIFSRGR